MMFVSCASLPNRTTVHRARDRDRPMMFVRVPPRLERLLVSKEAFP